MENQHSATSGEQVGHKLSSMLTAVVVVLIFVAVCSAGAVAQNSRQQASFGKRTVLVSIPDRKLVIIDYGVVLATFPVAVGADVSPSPVGEFEIVSRVTNPTYYHPGKVVPAGKDNPLGTRWIGLSEKGYGIHGTNAPHSIGRAASHGCIRLRNRDAERLFEMVQVGDVVRIRGERDEETARIFGNLTEEANVAEQSVTAGGQ